MDFIRLLIIARVLAPYDLGLIGIAFLTMAIFNTFSVPGFRTALIQKRGNIGPYLNSTWTILILRSIIIFFILYLTAPYIAAFFNAEEAIPVIRVIGILIIIWSISNIGTIYFHKELEFNKVFFYELAGILAEFIVTIFFVFVLRNFWALILGLVAGSVTKCFTSYLLHPFRPRFVIDFNKAKELWSYGRWVLGVTIITFLFNHGDDAFLGKVLGITALGFYQLAYRIGQLPTTEFAKIIHRITFPAYSKLQDNSLKLWQGFSKTLNIIVLFSFPLAGGVFILGEDFTRIFLGEKWMPINPALGILIIAGTIRAIIVSGASLFHGKGSPDLDFKMNLIRLITMAITIYPLTVFFGMTGVALSVVLGNLSCIPIWFRETIKITEASMKDFLKIFTSPLIGTVLVSLIMNVIKNNFAINMIGFIFTASLGILCYFAYLYIFEKFTKIKTFSELRSLANSVKGEIVIT